MVVLRPWLAARYAFTKRYSLDASSEDMIAPFAIFVESEEEWINRTADYAIEGFNHLYYVPAGRTAILEPVGRAGRTTGRYWRWYRLSGQIQPARTQRQNYCPCRNVPTAQTRIPTTDLGIIHQNIDAFSRSLVEGNFEAVVDAYTPDGKLFPQRGDIRRGEEAIRRYWTPPVPGKPHRSPPYPVPRGDRRAGRYGIRLGYYNGATLMGDGTGRYTGKASMSSFEKNRQTRYGRFILIVGTICRGIPGDKWKYVEIRGNTWKYVEIRGNTWKYCDN
ncbi:MAG: hypothetical protein H6559_10430 [Lewinellaceae bacterium]|nr:hypothetical protein [Lewinellaceae bacterium]